MEREPGRFCAIRRKNDLNIKQFHVMGPTPLVLSILILVLLSPLPTRGESGSLSEVAIPILLYHRFGPVVSDSMTITTSTFESHLRYIRDQGYTVIPLRHLVDNYLQKRSSLPSRALVITADDGHQSVYHEMFPLIKRYRFPVTLFLYPSVISNASYAITWGQLREMQETGLFDFQSHTFWHPNFKEERKRLNPSEYEKFIEKQLKMSEERLQKELNVKVDMLAWPFGIYDEWLIKKVAERGYVAGFTIERRHTNPSDNMMALPRYLIVQSDSIQTLINKK
jgi:peptidoglycan/xylan/chitin deacetylase (PgdA/CDA1 family)